jgi:hypothetical protein
MIFRSKELSISIISSVFIKLVIHVERLPIMMRKMATKLFDQLKIKGNINNFKAHSFITCEENTI